MLLFASCGKPIESHVIFADGSLVKDGRIVGADSSDFFAQDAFGNARAVVQGMGLDGTAAMQSKIGQDTIQFHIPSVTKGEHFQVTAWVPQETKSFIIDAVSPDLKQRKYEWKLRAATERVRAGFKYVGLNVTIPDTMDGLPLHVYFLPVNDSTLILDDIRIEHMSRRPNEQHHRKAALKDPRDGRTYQVVRIGRNWWMAEDFMFQSKTGLYTHEMALSLPPKGWRLPTEEDWFALERALGVPEAELRKTGGRSKNLSHIMLQGGYSGLNFAPVNEENAHPYWSADEASDSTAWSRFLPRHTGIGRAAVLKTQKLKVRLVMDR